MPQRTVSPLNVTRSGVAPVWSEPVRAQSGGQESQQFSGANWAYVVLNNANAEELQYKGTASGGIPASSIINGIKLRVPVWAKSPIATPDFNNPPPTDITESVVQLTKNGVPVGDNKASAVGWPAQIQSHYVFEDFVGTDGDTIVGRVPEGTAGNAWQVPGGGYEIKFDGTYQATINSKYAFVGERYGAIWDSALGNDLGDHVAIVDAGATDGTCGLLLTPTNGTNGQIYDFVFRYQNLSNMFYIRLTHGQRYVQMWKVDNGNLSLLSQETWGNDKFFVGELNNEYVFQWKISLSVVGSQLRVVISNNFEGNVVFKIIDLGSYDLRTFYGFRTTNLNARFDKFWVRGAIDRPFTYRDFGGETDLWGTTWAPSDISTLGWNLGVQNLVSLDETAALQPPVAIVYYSDVINIPVSGGAVAGAEAEVTFFELIDGTGGAVCGGSAEVSALLGVTEGGIVVGGESVAPFTEIGDGGVEAGGAATFIYNETMSGGVVAGGVAYEQWYIPAQGGAVLGEEAFVESYIVPLGGIVTGGQAAQTFFDYVDGTGGVVTGGNAIRADLRIFSYFPQGNIVIIGGEAMAGITSVNVDSDGGVDIAGEATTNLTFNLDLEFTWNTRASIISDIDFLWNLGQLPIFWYRIIGKGRPGDECNLAADPCCQKFIVNIHARTLPELCDKLRERRLNLPIESVQRFSRPAENDAEGVDDPCNELVEVEICEIPRCAEFCVDFENSAQDQNIWGFNMFVQVDSFFDFEVTDGVFISGSAGVRLFRNIPDFPHEAEGSVVIGGEAEVVSAAYSWEADGSIEVSGEADRAQSNWLYVGGEWPTIIGREFSTQQESLADSTTDQPWNLIEQIAADDGLYASTDISFIKQSEFLIARGFGFDVPLNSSISGLRVAVERFATQSGVKDLEVYLVVGDQIISDNLADTTNDWPIGVSFSPKVYGSNGYDGSGTTWSDEPLQVDDINNPEFGVAIRVESTLNLPAIIANVDYITAKLFYEDPDHQRLRMSGSAGIVSSDFSYVGDGTIFVEGAEADAIFTNEYDIVASGGMATGGGINTTEDVEASGGITLGGIAQVDPIIGEGGTSVGGMAKVTPYFEEGSGGVSTGGKSLDSWDKHYEASGFVVIGGEALTPDNTYEYEMSGGVVLGSDSDIVSSAYSWESSGNAVFILGGADYQASDLGSFIEVAEFDMVVTNILATFQEDQHFGDAIGASENIRQCGCLSVPLLINFEHNFVRNNILAQFLRRNNLSLPSSFRLNFNRSNTSWQANRHYKGFSADTNAEETWDIVFELQCTSLMGSIEIGRNIWKLAVQFFRRNLETGEDFDTRIIVAVLPEPICGTNANELNFTVTYDTQADVAVVDPSATIYQNSIFDNIGLFKKPSWILNPELVLTVSQVGLDTPQTTVDVVDDVLNPDDRPASAFGEGLFVTAGGPTIPPQLQNQN